MNEFEDKIYFNHLEQEKIENKEKLLLVIHNIDDSFNGRVDIVRLHKFLMESATMLKNSIRLFELGFFDAAFYSVRQAVELSRAYFLITNENNPEESELYQKWVSQDKFEMDVKIRKKLANINDAYSEAKNIFSDFYLEQEERLGKINKYVHKQGYKSFYKSFTSVQNKEKIRQIIKEEFIEYLEGAIKEVIIIRLCIDALPLILQDEDLKYKIHVEFPTFPFRDEIIDFLGEDFISKYKSTRNYSLYANQFKDNYKLSEATYNLQHYNYVDRNSLDGITSDFYYLRDYQRLIVLLFKTFDSATEIYLYNGIFHYFSELESTSTNTFIQQEKFKELEASEAKYNIKYDNAFLSNVIIGLDDFWILHNSEINIDIIKELEKMDKNGL